jgi:hypothetical protein
MLTIASAIYELKVNTQKSCNMSLKKEAYIMAQLHKKFTDVQVPKFADRIQRNLFLALEMHFLKIAPV